MPERSMKKREYPETQAATVANMEETGTASNPATGQFKRKYNEIRSSADGSKFTTNWPGKTLVPTG